MTTTHVDREQQFLDFLDSKKQEAIDQLIQEEQLNQAKFKKIIERYISFDQLPLDDDIV